MDEVTAHVVFEVFGIPITDTVTSTWMIMVIIVFGTWYLGKKAPVALEMIVDFLNDSLSQTMGMNAMPYLPFLGTLAIFIAAANLFSLIPGISNPARDLNTPIALALTVFFSVYYFGIRKKGVKKFLRELSDPIFLLPFEFLSQITRTLSLTLRLFGNMISIELIVAILLSLFPLIAPSIMAVYGAATGLIQAYIFTVLSSTYIASGVSVIAPDEEEAADLASA
ncbi:MAG: F0F1 ATP synthase subunit A [Anaerolineaceae bacterium]|nr:F0F1 ATP synthase subunit A [Anaerolineaceae bacterium]